MPRSTALTAFAALGLTVIAGLSAAAVTLDHGTSSATPAAVQYLDQNGNPVAAPGADTGATTASPTVSGSGRPAAPVLRDPGDDHEEDQG